MVEGSANPKGFRAEYLCNECWRGYTVPDWLGWEPETQYVGMFESQEVANLAAVEAYKGHLKRVHGQS